MPVPLPRLCALLVALSMALVACGQKPGVTGSGLPLTQHDGQPSTHPGPTGDASGVVEEDDGFGDVDAFAADDAPGADDDPAGGDGLGDEGSDVDTDAGGADTGGSGGTGGSTQGTSGGSSGQASGGQGGGSGGSGGASSGGSGGSGGGSGGSGGGSGGGDARTPQGSDRTGVTDDTLTLAIHAPVTGAAPLPSTSFERAADLYWRWQTEERGREILGRSNVEVVFADDRYEPSTARQVCRQLSGRAFLLVGGGGTDQIQACGQLAGQLRLPYLSPGVTQAGLGDNPWYFATSMTYPQQGALLAQYARAQFGDQRVAAVVTQTGNFDDAVAGWEAGVQREGLDYYRTLRHPRSTGWHDGFAAELADNDVDVVYMLTSPLDYIQFAQRARRQGHDFQYIGVGVTMGLNPVLQSGCPDVDGGIFFSPFPAVELADQLDADFRRAAQRFNAPSDDLAWALWGLAKVIHALLLEYEGVYGHDLTREDFRAVTSSAGRVETGIFPRLQYQPGRHFGGTGVHVLRADCSSGQYRDAGTFRSGF